MKKEIWKDIFEYESLYQISSSGNVRSLDRIITRSDGSKVNISGRVLKYGLNGNGYKHITLSNKKTITTRIHKLVAKAFIQNPENKPCINHKNGIKTDNRVENLEWCTQSYNLSHALKLGLRTHPSLGKFGKDNPHSKITLQLSKDNIVIKEFSSLSEAGEKTGVNFKNISSCCNNKRNTAGGYKWKYKN